MRRRGENASALVGAYSGKSVLVGAGYDQVEIAGKRKQSIEAKNFPFLLGLSFKTLETMCRLFGLDKQAADTSRLYMESVTNPERFVDLFNDDETNDQNQTYSNFRKAVAIGACIALDTYATKEPALMLKTTRRLLQKSPKDYAKSLDAFTLETLGAQSVSEGMEALAQDIQQLVPRLEELVKERAIFHTLDSLGFDTRVEEHGEIRSVLSKPRDKLGSLDDAPRDVLLGLASLAIRAKLAEVVIGRSHIGTQEASSLTGIRGYLYQQTASRVPAGKRDQAWEDKTRFDLLWTLIFAVRWAIYGLPVLSPTHKLAAANMATSIPKELVPEISLPWKTFLIDVPQGLLPDDVIGPVRYIGLMNFEEVDSFEDQLSVEEESITQRPAARSGKKFGDPKNLMIFIYGASARPKLYSALQISDLSQLELGQNLAAHHVDFEREEKCDEREVRLLEVVGRLILGSLIELDSEDHKVAHSKPKDPIADERVRRGQKLPTAWSFVLKRDVKVDARAYVHDYVAHGSRKLSVQMLVRGHRKRQPYGPMGSLRKWVHIEPYWRGPEDAPIAIRTHKLGGDNT